VNYGCNDAVEALAAYALDALDAGERLLLVEHLAECREHDEELAAYRMVATRLPLIVEPPAMPAALKGNLLDAFDREKASSPLPLPASAAAPVSGPEATPRRVAVPEPQPQRGGFFAIFRQPALAYGMAAALLIAVLGLAVWNFNLRDDNNVMTTAAAGPGMSINVTYYEDQQVAVFDVDMPPPASGQVYQAWMIADGKPVSVGLLTSNSGRQAFATDMAGATAVAISVEPAGGSQQPTTTPVVIANF
jgi:hypothetical protein